MFQHSQPPVRLIGVGGGREGEELSGERQNRLAREQEYWQLFLPHPNPPLKPDSPTRVSSALHPFKHGHKVEKTHCCWLRFPLPLRRPSVVTWQGQYPAVTILLLLEPWGTTGLSHCPIKRLPLLCFYPLHTPLHTCLY